MFDDIPVAPPDALFGLTEAFRADPNPAKINLGVGVYRDEDGRTPILEAVKLAEQRIWEAESSKSYLAIEGDRSFSAHARRLLLDEDHPAVRDSRSATAQTPGGTGAIRVAAELLRRHRPHCRVWLSDPTWMNHAPIFSAAGLEIATYPYLDSARRELVFDAMLAGLEEASQGDIVVLHGCCHNPSGVDLELDQWSELARALQQTGVVPLIDIAYQGFGQGLVEDVAGLRQLCSELDDAIICSSFSKNFALYNERVGALTVMADSEKSVAATFSQIKTAIRACYSNPPAHGAKIVALVLDDDQLRESWRRELAMMRERIVAMRSLFVHSLEQREVELQPGGNDSLLKQQGMFSFSGLRPEHVEALRRDFSIYIVGSGRINFAGLTPGNVGRLCDAIAEVVG